MMHCCTCRCPLCFPDASMYAHYLFNAFDAAQNGSVKFEVISQFCVFKLLHPFFTVN